eukprot:3628927-Rhodomonas_salina.5
MTAVLQRIARMMTFWNSDDETRILGARSNGPRQLGSELHTPSQHPSQHSQRGQNRRIRAHFVDARRSVTCHVSTGLRAGWQLTCMLSLPPATTPRAPSRALSSWSVSDRMRWSTHLLRSRS